MEIISRKNARLAALKFYFSGCPCPHGHTSPRYTSNKQCLGCVPRNNRVAYAKNPEVRRAASRAWHWANREHNNARRKANNPYTPHRDAKYHAAHRTERNARVRNWRKKNGDRVNEASSRKRTLVRQATPAWADKKAILAIYRGAKRIGPSMHVDHVVPLRSPLVCGLHWEKNLQVLPAIENVVKRNTQWPDMP